jgi:hypothetical protein
MQLEESQLALENLLSSYLLISSLREMTNGMKWQAVAPTLTQLSNPYGQHDFHLAHLMAVDKSEKPFATRVSGQEAAA